MSQIVTDYVESDVEVKEEKTLKIIMIAIYINKNLTLTLQSQQLPESLKLKYYIKKIL